MDANEGKAQWVLGPHSHFNQRGAPPVFCVPREDKGFCLLDFIKEQGEKWGAVRARVLQAPHLLTVIVPKASWDGHSRTSRTIR